jgi:hypothetical protein
MGQRSNRRRNIYLPGLRIKTGEGDGERKKDSVNR